MGEYQKAIVCWKKAVAIEPENGHFYHSIGTCYTKLNEFQQAAIWMKKGYNITKDANFAYDVGESLIKVQQPKDALFYYEVYLTANPNDQDCKK